VTHPVGHKRRVTPRSPRVTPRAVTVTPPAAVTTLRPVTELVLSLFPGIDLLGKAFAARGFCVVTGPEALFGSLVEDFRGLLGRFDGIIGGPACQDFSCARRNIPPSGHGIAMLRQFLRVVAECRPTWWLCENVPHVPNLRLDGYTVQRLDIWDRECGGSQLRNRHVQFGHREGWILRPRRDLVTATGAVRTALRSQVALATDYSSGRRSYEDLCRAQGLPSALPLPGLLRSAAAWAVGNGVPWHMGLALAEAVAAAGPRDPAADCLCGCGRPVTPRAVTATAACRKRLERLRRNGHGRVTVTWP
jgi:DNA (cytosine-5)-methyltransferase 1